MELPRRHFLRWLAASPILAGAGGLAAFAEVIDREPNRRVFDDLVSSAERALDVFDLERGVSNHGGRAEDSGRATIDALPEIHEAYLWGLGAFGQEGVDRVLKILTRELEITMGAAGTPSLASIGPHSIGTKT